MTLKRRYGYGFGDFFREAFNDIGYGFEYFPSVSTTTFSGQLVDTEKYDIVPKETYRQELIKQAEDKIKALDEDYKERRQRLVEEKESYTKALKQKNKDD